MIDEKIGAYESNILIGQLIEGMKEEYRSAILEKAAEARLSGENDEF